jgi:DNA-binding NarL/FixJ family response regulator
VVDDHDLFRTGLASLLASQPDIEVVAQASGGRMAVRLAGELAPDVVLMDARMPDVDGFQATREIVADHPRIRVVALTVAAQEDDVMAAVAAGACGFVAKDMPFDAVLLAVRSAAQGAAWFPPHAADVLLGHVRDASRERELDPVLSERLSSRELDVLRLIAQGRDNAAIATSLDISPRTAKNHVSSILAKLGVSNRVHAAVHAVRGGLA